MNSLDEFRRRATAATFALAIGLLTTRAYATTYNVPVEANLGTTAPTSGGFAYFWHSPGDVASIRALISGNVAPDRSWTPTPSTVAGGDQVDGFNYVGDDGNGLFALVGRDA